MTKPESWEDRFDEEVNSLKDSLGDIPEETCPNIDKLVKAISETDKTLQQANRYDDVMEFADDLEYSFRDIDASVLEDLRQQNEKLRELGKEWYEFNKWVKSFIAQEIQRVKDSARVDENILSGIVFNSAHLGSCIYDKGCHEHGDFIEAISQFNPIIFEESEE